MRAVVIRYGEKFDVGRHTSGTEIKAITFSNMQIHVASEGEPAPRVDLYVIVDI